MTQEIKHIDFEHSNEFQANGTKYIIKNTLTLKRFIEFEKLQNHFGFGLSFKQMYNRLNDAIEYANKGKGVEAWNIIFNLKEGIADRIHERTHPALLIASLFIVTEDEDFAKWEEDEQKKKFDDWNTEGIDVNDFFHLSVNLVRDFIPAYEEIIENTLKEEKQAHGKK